MTATDGARTGQASSSSAPATPIAPPSLPRAVTATNVVGTPGAVLVTWTAPAQTNGAAITGYTAAAGFGSPSCSTVSATSCIVVGVPAGSRWFDVTATNRAGTSVKAWSKVAVNVVTAPSALRTVTATNVSGHLGQVLVSWAVPTPANGAPVTGYAVSGASGQWTCPTTQTSRTISHVGAGSRTFSVDATNPAGKGVKAASRALVVPAP